MTLIDAVRSFLGPIMAEYCRLIDEYDGELPVEIHFGGYVYKTTLQDFKDLDRALAKAQEKSEKAADARRKRKAVGTLI